MEGYTLLLLLKQKQLDLDHVDSFHFDELSQLIQQDEIKNIAKELGFFYQTSINSRVFLSIYIIHHSPDIINNLPPYEIKSFKKLILEILTDLNNCVYPKEKIEEYANRFVDWKAMDKSKTLQQLSSSYKHISEELERETMLGSSPQDYLNHLQETRNKYQDYAEKIGGEIDLAEPSSNEMQFLDQDELVSYTNNMLKEAYWNKLYQELTSSPPTFSMLLQILQEIRETILYCSPIKRREQKLVQLDEYFDLGLIGQMINHNVFDYNDLVKIIKYIISNIQEYQAYSDDRELKEWSSAMDDLLKTMMEQKLNMLELLPLMLLGIVERLEKLKSDIQKGRELFS